jgi:hypothetical protein
MEEDWGFGGKGEVEEERSRHRVRRLPPINPQPNTGTPGLTFAFPSDSAGSFGWIAARPERKSSQHLPCPLSSFPCAP